jgi:acetyl/propionyl-CoA carboxylase alpha subunit
VWRGQPNRRSQRRDTAPLAERDGVVKKVFAKPGDSLAVDAVIMEFA